MKSLYLHLPFCKSKCAYCAFASYPGKESLHSSYLKALFLEMAARRGGAFDTLYIGGGTPSVLSAAQLRELFENIELNFGPVKNFKEATFEANPESLTEDKIKLLKEFGFSRLSIGAQSFSDACLKEIGRAHDKKTFLAAYNAARAAGFENINVDLIAGLPGQSAALFEEEIKQLLSLNARHISVYGLQIEEGTALFSRGYNPDQLLMRAQLERVKDSFQSAGYNHYEISNFALPGFESKHNTNYWTGGEYLGLGCAAASYMGGVRKANTEDLALYISAPLAGAEFEESLEGKAKLGERVLVGLRLLCGVEESAEVKEAFSREINALIKQGLLERAGTKIRLTREGLFLANEVFENFVEPFN